MFETFLAFVFGVIATLVCIYFWLWLTLLSLEKKSQEDVEHVNTIAAQKLSQTDLSAPFHSVEKKGKLKIEIPHLTTSTEGSESENSNHSHSHSHYSYVVLKSNLLVYFKHEGDSSAKGVIQLDGATLGVHQYKTSSSSPWNKSNAITVEHSSRDLMPHTRVIHFFAETGFELERWFYALEDAASMSTRRLDDKYKKAGVFFSELKTHLKKVHRSLPLPSSQYLSPQPNSNTNNNVNATPSPSSSSSSSLPTTNPSQTSKEKESKEQNNNQNSNTPPPRPLHPPQFYQHSNNNSSNSLDKEIDEKPLTISHTTSAPVISPPENKTDLNDSIINENLSVSSPSILISPNEASNANNDTSDHADSSHSHTLTDTHTHTPDSNNSNSNSNNNNNSGNNSSNNSNNTNQGPSSTAVLSEWPNTSNISPDWFNAILGRLFFSIHDSPSFHSIIANNFAKKISKIKKPSIVKDIVIKQVSVGTALPIIHSLQLVGLGANGEIMLDTSLSYPGGFSLALEILLNIKFPGAHVSIPAELSVTVLSFSGKANIRILPPPSSRFWIGFYTEPSCELNIDSSIGQTKRFKNLPKLAQIIIHKLKSELIEVMVLPNMDDFPIPNFNEKDEKAQKSEKINIPIVIPNISNATPPSTPSASPRESNTINNNYNNNTNNNNNTNTTSITNSGVIVHANTNTSNNVNNNTVTVNNLNSISSLTPLSAMNSTPNSTNSSPSVVPTRSISLAIPQIVPPLPVEKETSLIDSEMIEKEVSRLVQETEHTVTQAIASKKSKIKSFISHLKPSHDSSKSHDKNSHDNKTHEKNSHDSHSKHHSASVSSAPPSPQQHT